MTKKRLIITTLAVLIGGFFLYLHRDWFLGDGIQIYHRFLPAGGRLGARMSGDLGPIPVAFGFDRKLKLTSIQVVAVPEAGGAKSPPPVWHLVSDSNSVPTMGFIYGMKVPGMRPAMKGVAAEPLDLGVKYRLTIEAGSLKASHDFTLEIRR